MSWFGFALCSAFLASAAAVTQKRILFRLSALEFSFLVSVAILILSMFVPFVGDVLALDAQTLLLLIGKSILGGVAFLLVMTSLERAQISDALPLLGLTPAVTAILALVILGESLRGGEWVGIASMMVGVYVLEKRPSRTVIQSCTETLHSKKFIPLGCALMFFALSSVADKLLVGSLRIPSLVILFYQHTVYCLLFGGLLVIRGESLRALTDRGREVLPFIVVVALLTVAYRFTQLEAAKGAPVALVLAIKRTSILFASLFGGRLFSDERLAPRLLGCTIIVSAGFLILRNTA